MPINNSTSPAIFRWRPACWLQVSGEDAGAFLQGQFSNDLRALATQPAVYGLWLTLKGKVLADSFVARGAGTGEFWIGSYFSAAAAIRERLESHVIADDVTIADETGHWTAISVLGLEATTTAQALAAGRGVEERIFRGRRERDGTVEVVLRAGTSEPAWLAALAAVELDVAELARRRIAAAIPAVPADIGPADLPNEAGLETDAISYTKGCYLGQEVMARLKAMGQVRRRLVRVAGPGEALPALPTGVFTEARQVGELRSAVPDGAGGWIGLALVSRLHVTPEMRLAWTAGGEPAMRLLEVP